MQRRDSEYTGQSMLIMELPGRRGRPQRRFVDVLKESMQTVGVTEQYARNRFR